MIHKLPDITTPRYAESIFKVGIGEPAIFELPDGQLEMSQQHAVFHCLLWEPYYTFGLVPTVNDRFDLDPFTGSTISKAQTQMYDRLLEETKRRRSINADKIRRELFASLGRINRFVRENCGQYMNSLSILSLCKLRQHPSVKPLVYQAAQLSKMDTGTAEKQIRKSAKDLVKVLSDPRTRDWNPLCNFMQAGLVKANQLPQVMIAYGARSDVDDTMVQHVIPESTISGLKNATDYAVESLSAKKSMYFSKIVIRDSQYFARKLRLVCSNLATLYPGHCGNRTTVPFVIPKQGADNCLDKAFIDSHGQRQVIGDDNIASLIGLPLNLISPLTCKHPQGTCEYCAGRRVLNLLSYLPDGQHIGIMSATKIASLISQNVLSTKHLITTVTLPYLISESAGKYMLQDGTAIYWKPRRWSGLKGMALRIPTDSIRPLTDLTHEGLPIPDRFSCIDYLYLDNDEIIDMRSEENDRVIPHLAKEFLGYMKSQYQRIKIDENSISVPLDHWDPKLPFMRHSVVNDDMLTFTQNIISFFNRKISTYTSIPDLLADFTTEFYARAKVNLFFVEMVAKAFMVGPPLWQITPPKDIHEVRFSTLSGVADNVNISTKLAFEQLSKYFKSPDPIVRESGQGWYDLMFGF